MIEEQMKAMKAKPPMTYEQVEDFLDQALNPPKKSRKGFAAMSPEKHQEISRLGGKAAQAQGKAYKFTSETAAVAGKIGGKVSRRRKREQQG